MDKIAIFSDVHGNIPALEAILEDIEKRAISTIYCLGDFVGKGPNPNETIALCKKYCTQSVLGNWDDFLLYSPKDGMPISWYRQVISEESKDYLASLPKVIDFYLSGRIVRLFHAHPFDLYKRLYQLTNQEHIDEMFLYEGGNPEFTIQKNADIVGYGDIHYSFQKSFQKRILFNTGSAGNPLDATTSPYVILHGELNNPTDAPFSMEFVRVPYDNELAVKYAEQSEMPQKEDYIFEIKTGIFRMFRNQK